MRVLRLTILLLAVITMQGCSLRDNYDRCPPKGKGIKFRYLGDGTNDIFQEKIDKVNFYVFDQDGNYVASYELGRKELRDFQGIYLNLEPGNYNYIAWANTSKNTQLSNIDNGQNISDLYLIHTLVDEPRNSIDSLYYANSVRIVTKGDVVPRGVDGESDIIDFRRAHTNIEVFVKGYSGLELDNSLASVVNLSGFLSQYSFEMEPQGNEVVYNNTGSVVSKGGTRVSESSFFIPKIYDDAEYIKLDVFAGGDENLHTEIDLMRFVKENNIDLNKEELVISILIEYKDLDVIVSVPKWEIEEVEPGI